MYSIHETLKQLRHLNLIFRTHPLGFIQCVFYEGNNEYRLNVWGSRFTRPKTPNWRIHTHRYAFDSQILLGRIQDCRYRLVPDGLPNRALFSVEYQSAGSSAQIATGILNLKTQARVAAVTKKVYSVGDTYSVLHSEFHSSRSLSPLSISLMRIRPVSEAIAIVVGPMNEEHLTMAYVPMQVAYKDLEREIRAYLGIDSSRHVCTSSLGGECPRPQTLSVATSRLATVG